MANHDTVVQLPCCHEALGFGGGLGEPTPQSHQILADQRSGPDSRSFPEARCETGRGVPSVRDISSRKKEDVDSMRIGLEQSKGGLMGRSEGARTGLGV